MINFQNVDRDTQYWTGIIGSASYIVREVRLVRERETDGSDVTIVAKIGDEFTLSLPNIRTWRLVYTFPCQIFALGD